MFPAGFLSRGAASRDRLPPRSPRACPTTRTARWANLLHRKRRAPGCRSSVSGRAGSPHFPTVRAFRRFEPIAQSGRDAGCPAGRDDIEMFAVARSPDRTFPVVMYPSGHDVAEKPDVVQCFHQTGRSEKTVVFRGHVVRGTVHVFAESDGCFCRFCRGHFCPCVGKAVAAFSGF